MEVQKTKYFLNSKHIAKFLMSDRSLLSAAAAELEAGAGAGGGAEERELPLAEGEPRWGEP